MSVFIFFKQKTAYEMRISDWSSDVCSSDLKRRLGGVIVDEPGIMLDGHASRGDIDDNSAMGALAIFPATLMVAAGVFGEGGQGVLKRPRGTANISAIVDGVMVEQHRWQFQDELHAIRRDITHHTHIPPAIFVNADAMD